MTRPCCAGSVERRGDHHAIEQAAPRHRAGIASMAWRSTSASRKYGLAVEINTHDARHLRLHGPHSSRSVEPPITQAKSSITLSSVVVVKSPLGSLTKALRLGRRRRGASASASASAERLARCGRGGGGGDLTAAASWEAEHCPNRTVSSRRLATPQPPMLGAAACWSRCCASRAARCCAGRGNASARVRPRGGRRRAPVEARARDAARTAGDGPPARPAPYGAGPPASPARSGRRLRRAEREQRSRRVARARGRQRRRLVRLREEPRLHGLRRRAARRGRTIVPFIATEFAGRGRVEEVDEAVAATSPATRTSRTPPMHSKIWRSTAGDAPGLRLPSSDRPRGREQRVRVLGHARGRHGRAAHELRGLGEARERGGGRGRGPGSSPPARIEVSGRARRPTTSLLGENAAASAGTSGRRPQRHAIELAARRTRRPRCSRATTASPVNALTRCPAAGGSAR